MGKVSGYVCPVTSDARHSPGPSGDRSGVDLADRAATLATC